MKIGEYTMFVIGNRIRELREKNDINQQDLARYLKVAKSTLSQYETGSRIPNDDIKKAIAEKFNVSVDYLLGLTDIPYTIDDYIAKQKRPAHSRRQTSTAQMNER